MTVTPMTYDLTSRTLDETVSSAAAQERPSHLAPAALAGKLYQFHGFRVLDAAGRPVGIVDWIWSDEAGNQGRFLGVALRWLRGTARAIPADEVVIDRQRKTIQVAYSKEQITRAPRCVIDGALTAEQEQRIHAHYIPARAVVSTAVMADGWAA